MVLCSNLIMKYLYIYIYIYIKQTLLNIRKQQDFYFSLVV